MASTVKNLAKLGQRLKAPLHLRTVGHDVGFAIGGRRIVQTGLVEHGLLIENRGGEDGEWQTNLAFFRLVELNKLITELSWCRSRYSRSAASYPATGQNRRWNRRRPPDQRYQGHCHWQSGSRAYPGCIKWHHFQNQFDLILRSVEFIDDRLLDFLLCRIGTGAETDEPAHLRAIAADGRRLSLFRCSVLSRRLGRGCVSPPAAGPVRPAWRRHRRKASARLPVLGPASCKAYACLPLLCLHGYKETVGFMRNVESYANPQDDGNHQFSRKDHSLARFAGTLDDVREQLHRHPSGAFGRLAHGGKRRHGSGGRILKTSVSFMCATARENRCLSQP